MGHIELKNLMILNSKLCIPYQILSSKSLLLVCVFTFEEVVLGELDEQETSVTKPAMKASFKIHVGSHGVVAKQ